MSEFRACCRSAARLGGASGRLLVVDASFVDKACSDVEGSPSASGNTVIHGYFMIGRPPTYLGLHKPCPSQICLLSLMLRVYMSPSSLVPATCSDLDQAPRRLLYMF